MRAKTFFYVCAGLFLLAVTYHRGANSAGANGRRIVTRELVVTDDAGRQRATLTVDVGGPQLSLSDEAGYPTVLLAGASLTGKQDRAKRSVRSLPRPLRFCAQMQGTAWLQDGGGS